MGILDTVFDAVQRWVTDETTEQATRTVRDDGQTKRRASERRPDPTRQGGNLYGGNQERQLRVLEESDAPKKKD